MGREVTCIELIIAQMKTGEVKEVEKGIVT